MTYSTEVPSILTFRKYVATFSFIAQFMLLYYTMLLSVCQQVFRNILEKTSTFLGYENWGELLPEMENGKANPYESRIINISSHSKHSDDEIAELTEADKRVLNFLLEKIKKNHKFK